MSKSNVIELTGEVKLQTGKDYPVVNDIFGSEVPYCEIWTDNPELNEQVTETLGYVSLDKQVERLIEAGESLIVTRLREGTYSNEEGDEEFHNCVVDDLSMKSYDELVKLQRETADNFYIKKAALSHMIKQKKLEQDSSNIEEGKEVTKPEATKTSLTDSHLHEES